MLFAKITELSVRNVEEQSSEEFPIISDIMEDFNYINQILMVTRTFNVLFKTLKSFEILCDYKMEKYELINFIEEMEKKGFKFGEKTIIEFIDIESNDQNSSIRFAHLRK